MGTTRVKQENKTVEDSTKRWDMERNGHKINILSPNSPGRSIVKAKLSLLKQN